MIEDEILCAHESGEGANGGFEEEFDGDALLDESIKVKKPPMYQVVIYNDDYTTMEFVVHILKSVFFKTEEQSHAIMWNIHKKGLDVVGEYVHDIAESKVQKVRFFAKEAGYPLKCEMILKDNEE